jgi:hypothetical protein
MSYRPDHEVQCCPATQCAMPIHIAVDVTQTMVSPRCCMALALQTTAGAERPRSSSPDSLSCSNRSFFHEPARKGTFSFCEDSARARTPDFGQRSGSENRSTAGGFFAIERQWQPGISAVALPFVLAWTLPGGGVSLTMVRCPGPAYPARAEIETQTRPLSNARIPLVNNISRARWPVTGSQPGISFQPHRGITRCVDEQTLKEMHVE